MAEVKAQSSDFTARMSLHLNGGSKFSVLSYNVFYRDEPTEIVRETRTDGGPHYRKVSDRFVCGGDEFDLLAGDRNHLLDWLVAHVKKKKGKPASDSDADVGGKP